MKFFRLNEGVREADQSVMDHTLAKAYEFKDKKIKQFDDAMKELKLKTPNEEKDAHADIKTSEMKKMYLSEVLFNDGRTSFIKPFQISVI